MRVRIACVFVFVSGAMLVAVRLEKHNAAPRNAGLSMDVRWG